MWIFAFMVLTVMILKIHTLAQYDHICTPQKSFDCMENKWPNARSLEGIMLGLGHVREIATCKLNMQFHLKNRISVFSINFYEEDFSKEPTL